jgi:hypothetical protein
MYDEIISAFSGTAYADLATQERNDVVRELSASDREIIRFYKHAENSAAVEEREKRFNEALGARLSEIEHTPDMQSAPQLKTLRELSPIALAARPTEPTSADTSSTRAIALDKLRLLRPC